MNILEGWLLHVSGQRLPRKRQRMQISALWHISQIYDCYLWFLFSVAYAVDLNTYISSWNFDMGKMPA